MKINSVHFYVTDATNTANWFINCLGFGLVDTYQDDNSLTIAIANKSIFFVISAPINNQSAVAHYLASHAEGIVDITFWVDQLQPVINNVQRQNVKILQPIQQQENIKYACIAGWGDLQHTVIESANFCFCYLLPSGKLRTVSDSYWLESAFTFEAIDHIVLNVASGKLNQAVAYYQLLFNFQIQQTFNIKTERSGLYSQALIDRNGAVQFNINEPTTANSQIQEFINFNGGAGIQHLAIKSANLIQDVVQMRRQNVPFLSISLAYYNQLKQRLRQDKVQFSVSEFQLIKAQSILTDWQQNQPNSLLMQIFTQPIFKKPTFFLEFIERRQQAVGFGAGNFNALFTAVEREQIKN